MGNHDAAMTAADLAARLLAPLRDHRPGACVVPGPPELPGRVLGALCPALARGLRVRWIEGGNAFDAYGLARLARALRFDERAVLARILLARPFSAFQLNALLARKLPGFDPREPVILSDPMTLFFDDQMPDRDAPRAFAEFQDRLRALDRPILILAVEHPSAPRGRESFPRRLLEAARATLSIEAAPPKFQAPSSKLQTNSNSQFPTVLSFINHQPSTINHSP